MKEQENDYIHSINSLQTSKENWKNRALFKQKKLKETTAKLVNITFSRDLWKNKAIEAKKKLANFQAILKEKDTEIEALKKKIDRLLTDLNCT